MRFAFIDRRKTAEAFAQLMQGDVLASDKIEIIEMSDCHTVEQAINCRYGSRVPDWLECRIVEG